MFAAISFSMLLVALHPMVPAQAHSWYPHECCHDNDCAVVIALDYLPGGEKRVTTAVGFAVVPREFPIRPSPDANAHACLRPNGHEQELLGWTVVCLFLPGVV
jgi:hypothetical protein